MEPCVYWLRPVAKRYRPDFRSSDVDSSPRPAFMLIVDYPVVELEDHSSRGVSVRGSPQKLLVDLNLH